MFLLHNHCIYSLCCSKFVYYLICHSILKQQVLLLYMQRACSAVCRINSVNTFFKILTEFLFCFPE